MLEEKPRRKSSIRLEGYDYSQPGAYFVTVNVKGHQSRLGMVKDGNVRLSPIGEIVDLSWQKITSKHTNIELDSYVVMPNHLHGIIKIHEVSRGEAFEESPRSNCPDQPSNASPLRVPRGTGKGSLGAMVQNFKSVSSRRINQYLGTPGKAFWQRGYYDRIIRNQEELNAIRKYITENLLKWEIDEYHPSRALKLK